MIPGLARLVPPSPLLPSVTPMRPSVVLRATLLALAIAPHASAAAQAPVLPAPALGAGGAGSARAELPGAFVVNPALLAIPGRPTMSLLLPSVSGDVALSPIGPVSVSPYAGTVVPNAVKDAWMDEIRAAGGERVALSMAAHPLLVSLGNAALVSTVRASSQFVLPPEAAQLLLYGNAGRGNGLEDVFIAGARGQASVTSSAGIAMGRLVGRPFDGAFSIGFTPKVVQGEMLGVVLSADAAVRGTDGVLDARSTVMTWGLDGHASGATGRGLDVGAVYARERWSVAASVSDVINTLRYPAERAWILTHHSTMSGESQTDTTRWAPYLVGGAPNPSLTSAELAVAAEASTLASIRPTLRIATSVQPIRRLTLSADLAMRPSESLLDVTPRNSLGAGADLDLSLVRLRGGVQRANGGTALSAGVGLHLFVLDLDLAAMQDRTAGHERLRGAVGAAFSFGGETP